MTSTTTDHRRTATTHVPLHPLLAHRWSPRSFDPSYRLTSHELLSLIEAARWAPSANNSQPWRFVVTSRGSEAFDRLFSTLAAGNQVWAGQASALLLVAAETVDATGSSRSHAVYDTGQGVAQLVAQAGSAGLVVHQMAGFDAAAAAAEFELPAGVTPLVVLAVGRRHAAGTLPEPFAARESAPRTRLPIDQLVLSTDRDLVPPVLERLSA